MIERVGVCVCKTERAWMCKELYGWCLVRLGTCGHALPPSLPASQLLSTAVFAALTHLPSPLHPFLPPHPSLFPPPLPPPQPHLTVPVRLSSPPSTHTQRFFRRHRRRHFGSGFVALARTQLPRTTHLTQPPHTPLLP